MRQTILLVASTSDQGTSKNCILAICSVNRVAVVAKSLSLRLLQQIQRDGKSNSAFQKLRHRSDGSIGAVRQYPHIIVDLQNGFMAPGQVPGPVRSSPMSTASALPLVPRVEL